MRSSCLLVATLACATGCTIIYNTDDLRNRDAAVHDAEPPMPDAWIPDAIPIDADPSLLTITGVEPAAVAEGTGGEGGRPVVLLVAGDSIISGQATVAVAFTDGALESITPDAFVVAADQHNAAVAVRIPVDLTLDAGETRTLRLTFSQPGAADAAIDVTVNGLDELTLAAGSVAVTSLAALYSHIEVDGNVTFTGTVPARLRATGDIVLDASINVGGNGTAGGPNGCAGGIALNPGSCGIGRGEVGANCDLLGAGAGGGGGGYGDNGSTGSSVGGGMGGMPTGNDMLVPFGSTGTTAGNRGNGGGGGGSCALTTAGAGGGGGGVIEVHAGGDIVVNAGVISSAGAPGTISNGSGGGGGSGGAILIRAVGAITSSGAWLAAPGGTTTGTQFAGGAGSVGRIRVDAPAGNVVSMATEPAAIRGPAWDPTASFIVEEQGVALPLRGHPGRSFGVLVDGFQAGNTPVGAGGTGSYTLPALTGGRHQICLVYDTHDNSPLIDRPEGLTCIDVVYIPPP